MSQLYHKANILNFPLSKSTTKQIPRRFNTSREFSTDTAILHLHKCWDGLYDSRKHPIRRFYLVLNCNNLSMYRSENPRDNDQRHSDMEEPSPSPMSQGTYAGQTGWLWLRRDFNLPHRQYPCSDHTFTKRNRSCSRRCGK